MDHDRGMKLTITEEQDFPWEPVHSALENWEGGGGPSAGPC